MTKKHILLIVFAILQIQENDGVRHYALNLIYQNGEYNLPNLFYGLQLQQRKLRANGRKVTLFCPSKNTEDRPIDDYCLVPIKDDDFICEKPVKPILIKSEQLNINCGTNGKGVYYDFIYKICLPDEKILERNETSNTVCNYKYQIICFDTTSKETLFTFHKIDTPMLLNHDGLENEQKEIYELDKFSYDLPSNTFTNIESAFKNLNEPTKQRFTKVEELIFNNLEKLLLVSPDHMAFATWKIPVYHYINVKPAWQFTVDIWNKINEYILNTIQRTKFIQISGVIDSWKSNGETIYLDAANTMTVPKYFWKLIYIPDKKSIQAIIVHNVPNNSYRLPQLCNADSTEKFYRSINVPMDFAYICNPAIITNLFNLPRELDLLQIKENFSPLVLSFVDGKYIFPANYNGITINSEEEQNALFCPPLENEKKIFDESCLILKERTADKDTNPYCMKPVEPFRMEPKTLVNKCGMKKNIEISSVALGYQLCFKEQETIKKYNIEIFTVCHINEETVTYHHIISPGLQLNKNLQVGQMINYFVHDSTIGSANLDEYYKVQTNYAHETDYYSQDNEALKQLMMVSPNDMAFSAWKKPTYFPENMQFAWYEVEKNWNIINNQLQIQAIDKNQEYIHINGTSDSKKENDTELNYDGKIPSYIWKVVYSANMEENIAVIIHNKKLDTDLEEKLCDENACDMSKWNFGSMTSLESYAYCCEAKVITDKFNLPDAIARMEINDYFLPLVIERSAKNELALATTYGGLENSQGKNIFVCPIEKEESRNYDEKCLFPIENNFPYCKKPVEPYLTRSEGGANCGKNGDGFMYNFNYLVCDRNDGEDGSTTLKIYEICFNPLKNKTYYTVNSIRSSSLLYNAKLFKEYEMKYKLNNHNYQLEEDFSINEELYKEYMFEDFTIHKTEPLLLSSPDNMPFGLWKEPLYHHINVIPSWPNVINIWTTINEQIRNLAMYKRSGYTEINGVINFLKINGIRRNIPKFLWKIVRKIDVVKDIVIVVHNLPDIMYIGEKFCPRNICKDDLDLKFLNFYYGEMVYCCDAELIKKKIKL